MSIDKETVKKIASLSRIAITDAEADAFVPELNQILGWVEQLGEVDCSRVEPMTAVIPNKRDSRQDTGQRADCRPRLFCGSEGDRIMALQTETPFTLSLSKGHAERTSALTGSAPTELAL